jgi:hypothetical protein
MQLFKSKAKFRGDMSLTSSGSKNKPIKTEQNVHEAELISLFADSRRLIISPKRRLTITE